jgi:hypothetical protein
MASDHETERRGNQIACTATRLLPHRALRNVRCSSSSGHSIAKLRHSRQGANRCVVLRNKDCKVRQDHNGGAAGRGHK